MHDRSLVKIPLKLAMLMLLSAGVIITMHSPAKVEAREQLLAHAKLGPDACTPSSSDLFCFTPVDYGPGTGKYCSYVTGINNFENLIGTYQDYSATGKTCTGNDSGFYDAENSTSTGYGTPSPTPSDCPSCSFLMEGLNDGGGSFSSEINVGYWVSPPASTGCKSGSCGFFLLNNTWTPIVDTFEGSSPCHITHVLGINDVGQGVGYYETSGSPCVHQAFEYYPGNGTGGAGKNLNTDIVYANLNPTPLGAQNVSTEATGINIFGDVVGTMSWQVASGTKTIGWLYSDLKYYYLCYGVTDSTCAGTESTASINTFPEGIDFEGNVVGYYVSTLPKSAGTFGFITTAPETGSKWSTITDPKYPTTKYTIVRSIDPDHCHVTGWTEDSGGQMHGFVATSSSSKIPGC
jgi:hypothetical protein